MPIESFGQRHAVLQLDLMTSMVDVVKHHPAGQTFALSCEKWNNAVHAKNPRPLTIFTKLCFPSNSTSAVSAKSSPPFAAFLQGFNSFDEGVPGADIYPAFTVDGQDVILSKNRLYAGVGNNLEDILRDNNIDTVVVSGATLSGVVLSTVYRLFDLDYRIFVIADNVLELPLTEGGADDKKELMASPLGKLPFATIISVDQAIEML